MSILKTTMMTTALVFGAAMLPAAAFALADMTDTAKDMVVKEGKKVVKDKAHDTATDAMGDTGGMVSDTAVDIGADMMQGKSAKDATIGGTLQTMPSTQGVSESVSSSEAITAGKVIAGGGSMQDAAMEVAKDRVQAKAKDMVMEEASKIMGVESGDIQEGIVEPALSNSAPPSMAPVPAALPVNCPAGTTGQPNGTCMITGDYDG